MQPLDKTLRNRLERTIKDARDIAEDAARAALEQLGVGEAAPFAHLSDQDRELRRKLRVHGRQLGDSLNGGKIQTMDRLIEEVAYEHWHRMLFARFLAENNLLMYPDPDDPVAVTLEECEDLAPDEGAANGWELAARFAARMLPQIFRLDSPVFQLSLPPEHQQKLERLVADLPLEVFTASDSLGWVYQFWQAKMKDEVNASEVKIGARELPAVTQLFTEPYMVSFLLDNSLGAWWAARRLTEADLQNASSEEELRRKAAIPGVPLDYLRFVKVFSPHGGDGQGEGETWTPAAGTFDGWPEQLADLKTLDPCCGSGHFLVAAFLMLVPMRMERDGLSSRDAVDAVLRENIHGLELDQRCVELAAFALALTAWKHPSAGGYRMLPELNVACSGLSISAKKEEWLALAGDNTNLRVALEELYKQFKDAPILGSLINPEASFGKGSLFELKWEEVGPLLTKALAGEKDDERYEMGVVARGITQAATNLSRKYYLVVTNVPYLTLGKFNESLKGYCENTYYDARHDLATVFIERCLKLCAPLGLLAIVSPQNWIFLKRYSELRKRLLAHNKWTFVSKLGSGAFQEISGEVVKACLVGFYNSKPESDYVVLTIEAESLTGVTAKSHFLREGDYSTFCQVAQLSNPNFVIRFQDIGDIPLLSNFCSALSGVSTGELNRFTRKYWEISGRGNDWEFSQTSTKDQQLYTGLSNIILWETERGQLFEHAQSVKHLNHAAQNWLRGKPNWGKKGISLSKMSDLKGALYSGEIYDENCCAIIPNDEDLVPALWAYVESGEYSSEVRKINQSLLVQTKYMINIPFDLDHWTKVAEGKYPNGLPKPYSDDPTQWIFHGHPCGSVIWDEEKKRTAHGPLRTDDSVLHIAVARLLGYRWPAELDPNMELADEQREWVKRCAALASYADDDGIVCIPPVRGEAQASDRLLNLLAAAYGDAWSNNTLAALLKSADHAGKTLETWLREKFFTQHCKLFQHRPFIWHIWDGLRDGFAALVNYHKLDAKLLETLIYTYLGDWISRQKQDMASGVDGAQERLAAAEALKKKLELILEGEAPYDIFVRWKPLEKQPIGWDPDPNDGVRLNIRPFLTVPNVGKKGAGVLRDKPNINWNKDRGKDVESAPWYRVFKGERINDHHLSLEEKRAAREAAE